MNKGCDEGSRDLVAPLTFKPYHSDKLFYEVRLTTFNAWPKQIVPNKYSLAKAGLFYSGKSDKCICTFCNLRLAEWSTTDVPLDEHFRHSPDCIFLKMIGYDDKKAEGKPEGLDIPPDDTLQRKTAQRLFQPSSQRVRKLAIGRGLAITKPVCSSGAPALDDYSRKNKHVCQRERNRTCRSPHHGERPRTR
jgi:hypothetical protein